MFAHSFEVSSPWSFGSMPSGMWQGNTSSQNKIIHSITRKQKRMSSHKPLQRPASTTKRHLPGPHFLKVYSWDSPILTRAPRWTSRFVQLSGQTTVKWRHFRDFGRQEHHTETTHMVTSLKKLMKETDYLYRHVTVLDTTKNSLSTR